jgi:hypothetical protein
MFVPYSFFEWFSKYSTRPYTLAFSNTPGLLRPLALEDGKKSYRMFSYITPAGHTGLAFSCISYVDFFKICCTVDDSIMKDPHLLISLVEKNLRSCFDQGKTEDPNSLSATDTLSPKKT